MKNKLLSLLLLTIVLSVSFVGYAQGNDLEQTKKPKKEKEAIFLGKFWHNWFIMAGGGMGFYFSELEKEFELKDFKDRFGEAYQIGFGKWFLPGYGFRIMANGGKANVLDTKQSSLSWKPYDRVDGWYINRFNYINLNVGVMFNMMDICGGYKPERVYSVIPFIGAGFMRVYKADWKASENDEMSLSAGVMNYFRLSKHIALNLEAQAILQRTSAYKTAARRDNLRNVDVLFPVTLNLIYNFGPGFKKVACKDGGEGCSKIEEKLKEKEAEIERLKNTPAKALLLPDTVYVEKDKAAPVAYVEPDNKTTPAYAIFFKIDKYDLDAAQKLKIANLAKLINKTTGNYTVKGYADPDTGTRQRNEID